MGCGKSKHDVITGNTTKVRKPSEAESVKDKESDTIKRQENCLCRETDIAAEVSSDRQKTTVENNTEKPEENEAGGGDCGEKPVDKKNDDKKTEDKETASPQATPIVPENIVTEEIVNDEKESVLPVDEPKEIIDGDVNTETTLFEVKEPKQDLQTELEVQESLTTENIVMPVLKDEDKVDVIEKNPVDITKEVE